MDEIKRIEFTKEMKKTHTILLPNMCNIHFRIIRNIFTSYGYKAELLQNNDHNVVEEGLKYVHNDACYPAILTIGQMISALKSGKYDIDHTALMMTQTGGGCRASNYIFLLRKALAAAGMGQVPVISLNLAGLEKNSGFRISLPMVRRALAAVIYGDLLTLLRNQTKPYEVIPGDSDGLVERWVEDLSKKFEKGDGLSMRKIRKNMRRIRSDFEAIPVKEEKKIKVGIVGEIYVKYSPLANNGLEDFLFEQGCEVNVPGLLGFFLYSLSNGEYDYYYYGGKRIRRIRSKIAVWFLNRYLDEMRNVLKGSKYVAPGKFDDLRKNVSPYISNGVKMGEGWLLTAEMLELIESGYKNVICTQPFGCLPNHIIGKGMIRKIRQSIPEANIVAIDYDPGATKVNQENRIKLMLAIAREQDLQ